MTLTPVDILDYRRYFLNAFDPNHPSYHNGDPTPVPLGNKSKNF